MKRHTTIDQSKKLLALGLNPDTADMCWGVDFESNHYNNSPYPLPWKDYTCNEVYVPCWSLDVLMDLLPPSIQTGEGMQNQYEIDIRKYWGDEENLYQIAYGNDRGLSEEWHDMINTRESENLFDVALDMVCWLLENGYINKEDKYENK